MKIRIFRKEIGQKLSEYIPIKINSGISKNLKIYGDIFYNRDDSKFSIEEKFYSNYKFKNKVILDVGANIGVMSLYFSQFENTKVYSFEPNPIVFKILKKNIRKNKRKNIEAINIGVSDENNDLVFLSDKFVNQKGTFDTTRHDQIKSRSLKYVQFKIKTITLDDYCNKFDINKIGFIKMDTEGFEINVLKGAINVIEKSRPDIYFEIHGKNLKDKEVNLNNIYHFLNNMNYQITSINDYRNLNHHNIAENCENSYDKYFACHKEI